jgi:hypothetical protein
MSNKKVMFWLHRVLLEKCVDIKNLQERISVLGHQIQNFEKMNKDVQDEVIEDLTKDLRCYDWAEAIVEVRSSVEEVPKCLCCGKPFVNAIDSYTKKVSAYLWKPDCDCIKEYIVMSRG